MLEAERHDPERVKRWVVLVDGAETQLALVEAGAAAYGVDVTVILDIIHVVEYVWKAAHVFHREGSPDAAHWAWTRVQSILEGKSSKVAAAMRRAAYVAGLSSDTRKPVDTCADYAEVHAVSLRPLPRGGLSHRHRRDRRGVPVPGPRPDGVDRSPLAMAAEEASRRRGGPKLRALRASGDFSTSTKRASTSGTTSTYADGIAPPAATPPSPSSPRLRRVK